MAEYPSIDIEAVRDYVTARERTTVVRNGLLKVAARYQEDRVARGALRIGLEEYYQLPRAPEEWRATARRLGELGADLSTSRFHSPHLLAERRQAPQVTVKLAHELPQGKGIDDFLAAGQLPVFPQDEIASGLQGKKGGLIIVESWELPGMVEAQKAVALAEKTQEANCLVYCEAGQPPAFLAVEEPEEAQYRKDIQIREGIFKPTTSLAASVPDLAKQLNGLPIEAATQEAVQFIKEVKLTRDLRLATRGGLGNIFIAFEAFPRSYGEVLDAYIKKLSGPKKMLGEWNQFIQATNNDLLPRWAENTLHLEATPRLMRKLIGWMTMGGIFYFEREMVRQRSTFLKNQGYDDEQIRQDLLETVFPRRLRKNQFYQRLERGRLWIHESEDSKQLFGKGKNLLKLRGIDVHKVSSANLQ